jgi:hypothetical protein
VNPFITLINATKVKKGRKWRAEWSTRYKEPGFPMAVSDWAGELEDESGADKSVASVIASYGVPEGYALGKRAASDQQWWELFGSPGAVMYSGPRDHRDAMKIVFKAYPPEPFKDHPVLTKANSKLVAGDVIRGYKDGIRAMLEQRNMTAEWN